MLNINVSMPFLPAFLKAECRGSPAAQGASLESLWGESPPGVQISPSALIFVLNTYVSNKDLISNENEYDFKKNGRYESSSDISIST